MNVNENSSRVNDTKNTDLDPVLIGRGMLISSLTRVSGMLPEIESNKREIYLRMKRVGGSNLNNQCVTNANGWESIGVSHEIGRKNRNFE